MFVTNEAVILSFTSKFLAHVKFFSEQARVIGVIL